VLNETRCRTSRGTFIFNKGWYCAEAHRLGPPTQPASVNLAPSLESSAGLLFAEAGAGNVTLVIEFRLRSPRALLPVLKG
jgi:hypothetical protein